MITNLNKQKSKKKAAMRNKRIGDLIQISEEVREAILRRYYLVCKERAASGFI